MDCTEEVWLQIRFFCSWFYCFLFYCLYSWLMSHPEFGVKMGSYTNVINKYMNSLYKCNDLPFMGAAVVRKGYFWLQEIFLWVKASSWKESCFQFLDWSVFLHISRLTTILG